MIKLVVLIKAFKTQVLKSIKNLLHQYFTQCRGKLGCAIADFLDSAFTSEVATNTKAREENQKFWSIIFQDYWGAEQLLFSQVFF